MSSRPTDRDSGLQRLIDDGYRVEVSHQHLLLHGVPYVTGDRRLAEGTLVCAYICNANQTLPPENHVVWWSGDFPCFPDGRPIEQIRNTDKKQELFPGFQVGHRFSNKPVGLLQFPDHYAKLLHYLGIIQGQAKAIDPKVDARGPDVSGGRAAVSASPFVYDDTASARSQLLAISERLAVHRVAIVGIGGTGAYILDQIAKTPVREIHLFDGDTFLQHNAFRSPGAARIEDLAACENKSRYFKRVYDAIHKGITSHPRNVDSESIGGLDDFDFVFVCVDNGPARKLISEHLIIRSTPFIDVGMDLQVVESTNKLIGSCRFTFWSPATLNRIQSYAPMDGDDQGEIYTQNIQIADMNALNAQLAVMRWKQHLGFYADDFNVVNGIFSVNSMSLARETAEKPTT